MDCLVLLDTGRGEPRTSPTTTTTTTTTTSSSPPQPSEVVVGTVDCIYYAARAGRVDDVATLLQMGEDPNTTRGNAQHKIHPVAPPLHHAVTHRRLDVAELLLQNGAEVDKPSKNGRTALSLAVNNKDVAMVRLLLAHGAKVAVANPWGTTVLMLAEQAGDAEILDLITKKHAEEVEQRKQERVCGIMCGWVC